MTTLIALIACHNRRDLTLRCLRSLFHSVPAGVTLSAVLVDDGSTDGTADAVRDLRLPVEIVHGDGSWFWSRSVAEAESVAERDDPDWLLWLNDDVVLRPDALLQWRMAANRLPDSILVGGLQAPGLGRPFYSGFDWPDRADLTATNTRPPNGALRRVEGFHGNFVAVPRSARRRIGPVDGTWPHNYADLDYALRAGEAGVAIWVLPRVVGECDPTRPAWMERRNPRWIRVRSVVSRKNWPVRAHWRLHRRHGTGAWPIRAWTPHWYALTGRRRTSTSPETEDGGDPVGAGNGGSGAAGPAGPGAAHQR